MVHTLDQQREKLVSCGGRLLTGCLSRIFRRLHERNAFEFMRRNMHFANNTQQKAQSEEGYDPLFKVTCDQIGKGSGCSIHAGQANSIGISIPVGMTSSSRSILPIFLSTKLSNGVGGVSEKPNWVRQGPLIPCDCDVCCFCINPVISLSCGKGNGLGLDCLIA